MNWRRAAMVAALGGLMTGTGHAQTAAELAIRFAGMTAVAGYEQALADTLVSLLPGAERDRAGNVVAVLGGDGPNRLAVCPIDEAGFVVGRIHRNGYLTLRRLGRGPAVFEPRHEGRRVVVWGRRGPVPAVVGAPSTHLTRGGPGIPNRPFGVAEAWVDVGAADSMEVANLGIEAVQAVALEKTAHQYGDSLLAAPEAAQRGACAALVAAYRTRGRIADGRVTIAFVVESRLGHRGLSTLLNQRGPFEASVVLAYPSLPRSVSGALGRVTILDLPARYVGWAAETVGLDEVNLLAARLAQWMEAP